MIRVYLYELFVVEGPTVDPRPLGCCTYATDPAEAIQRVYGDPEANPDGIPPERLIARLAEFSEGYQPPDCLVFFPMSRSLLRLSPPS